MSTQILHIVCNLLPVGPRRTLMAGGPALFSLQLTGGYEVAPEDPNEAAKALLPWSLLPDATVEIHIGYRKSGGGGFAVVPAAFEPPPAGTAIDGFRQTLTRELTQRETAQSVLWQRPLAAVAGDDDEADDAGDFEPDLKPALTDRLLYLSTLPTAVSRPLRAALYFTLDPADLTDIDTDAPLIVAAPTVRYGGAPRAPSATADPFGSAESDRADLEWAYAKTGDQPDIVANVAPLDLKAAPNSGARVLGVDERTFEIDAVTPLAGNPVQRLEEKLDASSDPALLIANVRRERLTESGFLPGTMADALWSAFLSTALFVDIDPRPPTPDAGPPPADADERRRWQDQQRWRYAAARLRNRMLARVIEAARTALGDASALPDVDELRDAMNDTLNLAKDPRFADDAWLEVLRVAAAATELRAGGGQETAIQEASERELVNTILQGAPDLAVLSRSFWLAALRAWRNAQAEGGAARQRFEKLLSGLERAGDAAFRLGEDGPAFPAAQGLMRARVLLRQLSGEDSGAPTLAKARAALKEHLEVLLDETRVSAFLPAPGAGGQISDAAARNWLTRRRLPHDEVAVEEFQSRLVALLDGVRALAAEHLHRSDGYIDNFPGLQAADLPRESVPSGLTFTFGTSQFEARASGVSPDDQARTFAGYAVAVQRRSRAGEGDPWIEDEPRLANAGLIADGAGAVLNPHPVVVPIRPTYGNDLLRPEITYEGAVLGIDDQRQRAMPGANLVDDEEGEVEVLRYRPLPSGDTAFDPLRPPPLRAGDEIRVAIWGVGSAGGLARTLSGPASPDRLDPAHFAAHAKAEAVWSAWTQVRRRVPVGDISLLPLDKAAAEDALQSKRRLDGTWPSPPETVRPLLPELINRDDVDGLDVPEGDQQPPTAALLLMSPDTDGSRPDAAAVRRFSMLPPLAKPRVLTLWELPTVGAFGNGEDDQAVKQALVEQLVAAHAKADVARERAMELQTERESGAAVDPYDPETFDPLFIDPAVAAVGARLHRLRRVDGRWTMATLHHADIDLSVVPGRPYDARVLGVEVRNTEAASPSLTVPTGTGTFAVEVPPDALLLLELHALVRADQRHRVGDLTWSAMQQAHRPVDTAETADPVWPGDAGHLMLPGDMVAIERVSTRLPSADRLWGALTLNQTGQSVHIAYVADAAPEEATATTDRPEDYVAEFRVTRQHWKWRGLPIAVRDPSPDGGFLNNGDARPPLALLDPERRDAFAPVNAARGQSDELTPGEHLEMWDAVLAMANGFVEHRLSPKQWDAQAWNDTADPGTIDVDERHERTGSDYHRYAMTARSRYAGVLPADAAEVATDDPERGAKTRRRLFVPYRGPAPSAPVVLAILPLTHGLAPVPIEVPPPAPSLQPIAPVVVVCDHAAYGAYGLGDTLVAELVRDVVDGDTPPAGQTGMADEDDDEADAVPLRVGPTGESYVAKDRGGRYWGNALTRPTRLKVWGPFGWTFESTAEEVAPATSAYVVYPPEEIGPHWIAEVAFRRAVSGYQVVVDAPAAAGEDAEDKPDDDAVVWAPLPGLTSESQGSHQIEFRGIGGDGAYLRDGALTVVGTIEESLALALTPERLPVLHPTQAAPSPEDVAGVADHRYVAMVSRLVTDGAIGDRVPLPIALYTVRPTVVPSTEGGTLTLSCRRFAGEAVAPSLGAGDVIVHVLEVRTDRQQPPSDDGAWRFDDPTAMSPKDFWDALLPIGVRLSDTAQGRATDGDAWRRLEALDLPDAAGRIERVFGPFNLERP